MSKKYINSVKINENQVKKKYNKNIIDIYDIFATTDFENYPKIIDLDDEFITYEYIESKKYYEKIKGVEFIKLVSLMHSKTIFYKDVSKNKYKKIYNSLYGNIKYLKKYYLELIDKIENEMFMSPSHYLFARNYSAIQSNLNYAESTLKKWFKKVENKENERVCVIHNNLSLKHFIKSDIDYLVSFDGALVDTPILDLYKFYKKEGYKLNFKYLLKVYNENMNLFDEEKLLLNVLLILPLKIEFVNDEYINVVNLKNNFNYIYSSMNVVNENK
ncbi:MAG: hypothetical protein PUA90_05825 [bacterium]|nr:hypothetical protein [bacterium]